MEEKQTIEFSLGHKTYTEVIQGNIMLSRLVPDEVMDALNRAVGKYAFYGALRADAKRMEAMVNTDAKAWNAEKFHKIQQQDEYKKATGKIIDTQIIIQFPEEWRKWQAKVAKAEAITDKMWILIQSFELMTKTLQSVLAMQRTELNHNYSGMARGSGDILEDER